MRIVRDMMLQNSSMHALLRPAPRASQKVSAYQRQLLQSCKSPHGLRLPLQAITLILLFCNGCAFTGMLPVPTLPNLAHRSLAYYHAFGDSITYGYDLPDRLTQAYPVLISVASGLPLHDYGLDADQACDVPARQLFSNADAPSLEQQGLYTLLISTNDVDHKGIGPYEAVFNLCHQAAISWMALPAEFKVLATASQVSTAGQVILDKTNNWNSLVTMAQNASVSFTFSRTIDGPVYIWHRIIDNNPGTFEYSLDKQVIGSGKTATNPDIFTLNGTNDSLALLRLPRVSSGPHTLTFRQTSEGSAGFAVTAIGLPPGEVQAGFPRVLVGTTPRQEPGATCSNSDNPCAVYIADITANVHLIAGDGLDVELFDSRKYTTGTGIDMVDSLHPNPLGHYEIARSVADVLK